ncbi:MAG: adenylyl-sulfate kinase [Bryobacteraceae bacterium]|jgi:adenylylsulfate kinase-like enzyme/phosphohistidine swiveling domain-containing protein
METSGRVFWITGLSAAGKTSIGRALSTRLRASGCSVVFLDGDTLRSVSQDLGYSAENRRAAAMRNGMLCRMLAEQGLDVVCSTISLFHEVQRWNRENIPNYNEIFVRVPIEELKRRDTKGVYSPAPNGRAANIVGLDIAAEFPETPDLILDNDASLHPEEAVRRILEQASGAASKHSPAHSSAVQFGTKAETLDRLAPLLRSAAILPQVRFSVGEWRGDPHGVLKRVAAAPWASETLIVRSSAKSEDSSSESQAGKFTSVAGVDGCAALAPAVERVIASYEGNCEHDQVFVQPMLTDVAMAGVAVTREPSGGGPYFVINYDDSSGRSDVVTSGAAGKLKTFICLKSRHEGIPSQIQPILELLRELESLLHSDGIDVEFAVAKQGDKHGALYLLQVRPLAHSQPLPPPEQRLAEAAATSEAATEIAQKVALLTKPHPYLHGNRSVYGVMPDWNPAEIVGLKPRPLALSLYRELITDSIWAYQRNNYGYKNLRSFPLLMSFHGLPYIDVRVSFNSFLPRDMQPDLAERLVNYYIERLLAQPTLHDKVEFEIIFSCYTLDLPERLLALAKHGFSSDDIGEITCLLRNLTNKIINNDNGLWVKDREKVDRLAERLPKIRNASLDKISRVYWLLEDCKRYGTLPFAGLARAGFIANQFLNSLVSTGVLDRAGHAAFMSDLETVGSQIGRDFAGLTKDEFLARYGHLRPGTYDILSPRYDEAPDLYFDWSNRRHKHATAPHFLLSVSQLRHIERLLKEHGIEHDILSLIHFIKGGIEGREYAKFIFTRSLSDALSLVKQIGEENGLSTEDCSFLDINDVRALYSESGSVAARLKASVAEGKRRYSLTRRLVLPPLISSPDDALAFHLPSIHPNFITKQCVTAHVSTIDDSPEALKDTILFVPSADPGFDWIFSRGIAGFVTQFGGVNSHMAIRANELAMPAVIGAGETLFGHWKRADKICLDCGNQQVQVVS